MPLTKYEITRLISARAEQLACGAPPLVKTNKNSTAYTISKKEFEEKVIPLAVLRIVNGKREIVKVN
jgi:DNA-directed RNA polymerase subunit K/omega